MTADRDPQLPTPPDRAGGAGPMLSATPAGPPRFVVPVRGRTCLVAARPTRLDVLAEVSAGWREWAVDPLGGWYAYVSPTHVPTVAWGHEDGRRGRLPPSSRDMWSCLALTGGVLFVGGRQSLVAYDLEADGRVPVELELPPEFRAPEKAFDDLLVDGGRLLALDDVVSPKWLFTYDVTDPRRPRLTGRFGLSHGINETLHQIAVGGRWAAVRSEIGFRGGHLNAVRLLDRAGLGEVAQVTTHRIDSWAARPGPRHDWESVDLLDDVLLIAAGAEGVGVCDLSGERLPDPEDRSACRELAARCGAGIRYRPVPGGGAVRRVHGLPGTRRMLAVVETPDGPADTVLADVPS